MMPACMQRIMVTIVLCCIAAGATAQSAILPNAFSHNDYRRKRPLLDALNNGFRYVEADIYLRKGELIVAHILPCLKPNRTLEALYLKPLMEYVQQDSASKDLNKWPLTLLIDIKSDGEKTYQALLPLLEKYKAILSGYENGQTTLRNVTIVLSGHKPVDLIKNTSSGYVFMDDNLKNISSYTTTDLFPIASCKYSRLLKWKGKGSMPASEMQRLEFYVAEAHRNGSKVRLWAAPQNIAVWNELLKCNVDLINTDHLSNLRRFLTASNAGSF
jgi:hypothetical protein